MTMLEELNELLEAIDSYWKLTDYEIKEEPYFISNVANDVITEWSSDAVLFPLTNLPIRGSKGVTVNKFKRASNTIYLLVETTFKPFDSWDLKSKNPDILEAKKIIDKLLNNVLSEFDKIPGLNERIFDALGYKHYDATELSTAIADDLDGSELSIMNFLKISALKKVLINELNKINYKIKDDIPFEARYQLSKKVIESITKVSERIFYKYKALIFLNAPLVDDNESISLGGIKVDGFELELNISYADDKILSKLSSLDADCINTVCSFNIEVKVDANVDIYLYIYELAGRVAEKLVDSLRLICNCDLGVLGLEVVPDESFTPAIRKTFETRYQQELAPIIPKRFHYQLDSLVPITEAEINEVRQLLSYDWYTNTIKGVDIAIKRFRSSIERYMPDDAEKLLDLAIAFESIYLNDGETKELTYRLSLRVARLLGNSVDERYKIFNIIKDLYKYRSKVAHGENLDSLKKSDAERLNKVLKIAPTILKKSIIKIFSFNELKGLKDNAKIAEWWSKLELQ